MSEILLNKYFWMLSDPISHLHIIKKLCIFLIIVWWRYLFLLEGFKNILIIQWQSFIWLIKLFLTFKINLITLIMILSFNYFILKFKNKCFKCLPLYLRESIIYWCELLFVFRFFNLTKVALKVTLILLLLW